MVDTGPDAAKRSAVGVYFSGRMAALVGLGFAAGLPSAYMYLGSSLQAWLGAFDYDLKTIGLSRLVAIPFAFNFLWAPLIDRFVPKLPGFLGGAKLGRRRSWLVLIQSALVIAMTGLALAGPTAAGQSLAAVMVMGVLVAVLAATQDVVVDAYRTDVLSKRELGAGAAVFVNGYRIGMLLAGGGALMLAERIGWRSTYLMLAGAMSLGLLATLLAPEPPGPTRRPSSLWLAVVAPVAAFLRRWGWRGGGLLAFILLFKLPDALADAMVMPLLQKHLLFSNDQIAVAREWTGIGVLMIGALIGGGVVAKLGLWRSLWLFIGLQAVSNLGYVVLARAEPSVALLAGVVVIENLCKGMVTAGFIALLMSLCDRRFSATQYALFTSLNYFAGAIGGAPTGVLVERVGYADFFLLTMLAALPAAVLLWLVQPARESGN